MNTEEKLNLRINQLIELADNVLRTESKGTGSFPRSSVDNEQFNAFKNASLSFILNLYPKDHPYYENFFDSCNRASPYDTKSGRGILTSIKTKLNKVG